MTGILIALSLAAISCDGAPDGRALLRQAAEASRQLRAVHYTFQYHATGVHAASEPRIHGSLLLQRMGSPVRYRMRLEGEWDTDGREYEHRVIVTDGDVVYSASGAGNAVRRAALFSGGGALRSTAQPAVMEVFLSDSPFKDEIDAESVSTEGSDAAGGVLCDLVRVKYADDDEDSRWCLDRESRLPLRLEWITPDGSEILELADLQPNPELDAASFHMEIPAGTEVEEYSLGLAPGESVPPWTLAAPDGTMYSGADLTESVVVLDFWASWCPPCLAAMAGLQKLHEEFADQPVKIFAVNVQDTVDPVQFLAERGITYELLLDGDEVLESTTGGSVPSFIVIRRGSTVEGVGTGYYGSASQDYLRGLIEAALEG